MFVLYIEDKQIGFDAESPTRAIEGLVNAMDEWGDGEPNGSPPIHGKIYFEEGEEKSIVAEITLHYPPKED